MHSSAFIPATICAARAKSLSSAGIAIIREGALLCALGLLLRPAR
jgi:hypothetical protein